MSSRFIRTFGEGNPSGPSENEALPPLFILRMFGLSNSAAFLTSMSACTDLALTESWQVTRDEKLSQGSRQHGPLFGNRTPPDVARISGIPDRIETVRLSSEDL